MKLQISRFIILSIFQNFVIIFPLGSFDTFNSTKGKHNADTYSHMIDTIVMDLEKSTFDIMEPDRFTPSARGIIEPPFIKMGSGGYLKCIQNPTNGDKKCGVYMPRLTLFKNIRQTGYSIFLRVEFSAPKMLFNNNFDELHDNDFDELIYVICKRLHDMGVMVETRSLRSANISSIHFSKNVAFTDYTTSSMIINELQKIDLNKRLDLSRTVFRNNGHALSFHCNSYEVVFYDKLRDIKQAKKSEKRAIETDNYPQLNILASEPLPKQFELLRLEVRLNTKKKIKSILDSIGIEPSLKLSDLFNKEVSKSVVHHFWEKIFAEIELLSLNQIDHEYLFNLIRMNNPDMGDQKILQLIGTIVLIDQIGIRGLRSLLRDKSGQKWRAMKKGLDRIGLPKNGKIRLITSYARALESFSTFKLDDMNPNIICS